MAYVGEKCGFGTNRLLGFFLNLDQISFSALTLFNLNLKRRLAERHIFFAFSNCCAISAFASFSDSADNIPDCVCCANVATIRK